MFSKILFLLILICFEESFGLEPFFNQYNQYGGGSIVQYKIFGERCSGTNFVDFLVKKNFPTLRCGDFGSKHFPWWFDIPPTKEALKKRKLNWIYLKNSERCLFILVVRNPYDWLRSFYLSPHHVSSELREKGFGNFISQTWKSFDERPGIFQDVDNYNPYTCAPFKNILELRSVKIRNFLKIPKMAHHFCLVRYEDVAQNPEGFVNYLANFYDLEKKEIFEPITTYKGSQIPFVQKEYFLFKKEELEFINHSLDWSEENQIGYFMRTDFKLL